MSSEIYTYFENLIKKNKEKNNYESWKLEDDDQIKAITGICITFGVFLIIGLFVHFTSI